MPRQRDHAAEYRARVERGRVRGLTARASTGHSLRRAEQPRGDEPQAPDPALSREYPNRAATRTGAPDEEGYVWQVPTHTSNPGRPRTKQAAYNPDTQILRVEFRDGSPYNYYGVQPSVWETFKQTNSPGRFINRVLTPGYDYNRAEDWEP